ncbi:Ca2+/Na+ antiporter [Klebsiella sp. BIGb0407]|nr:Ca2+/Na+ antiporter [Klebsiella sp. BIGb0407]
MALAGLTLFSWHTGHYIYAMMVFILCCFDYLWMPVSLFHVINRGSVASSQAELDLHLATPIWREQ